MADIEKADNGHHHDRYATAATAGPAAAPTHLRTIANPAPLGLFSFASTTLMLSLFNVNVKGVTNANIVVGMAIACGGGAQLLAGMWEFACGNTFGATAFSSYGAFWISYALIFIPGANIGVSYTGDVADQEHNAVGVFLMVWFIVTFIFFIASLRSTMALVALFFFLDITFLLLMIGEFMNNVSIHKAGGGFGILTAFIAYYAGASALITHDNSFVILPSGNMPKRRVSPA
ncbi:Gpr1 family protein [Exidia glandulosa HHB12029]|uniref:Gpr1 family protein n=1 Tax=Exidia glandulosa HHB12029 TaxID=1314781 RepID=A0A165NGC8_EXIGL|nr:Gpr1 family protein [Exidia glandulosa HHB12029]